MDNQKTEKVTINLGIMDLAEIDLLVDSMIYTNRSDFIRIATRNLLETHKNELEKLYQQSQSINFEPTNSIYGGIGIIKLNQRDVLNAYENSKKIHIMVMGILIIDNKISSEQFEATVENIKIYGKIQAPKQITELINKKGLKK